MSTSLVVKLEGDISSLNKDLTTTKKNLRDVDKSVSDTDKGLASMTKGAAVAGSAVLGVAKAAIAVGTALTTMITLTAKGEQELQVFAKTARTTTSDFEALAFAAKQVGLDAKGTADAMNDVNERLAEFGVGKGAGAFDDFAQAMNLSKEEAMGVAAELKELSGEDALRELVKQMEDAGTSTADMNFVLKSLSNDLAYASGLFEGNGKELDRLKDRYNEVNKALSITQEEAKGLTGAAESFDLLTETLGNGAKVISAQLAPALSEFFNSVIDVVPEATQAILDFINSFKDTESITNEQTLTNQIEDQKNAIKGLQGQIVANQNVIDNYYGNTDKYVEKQKRLNEELKQEQKELEGIEAQLKKVQEEKDKDPKDPKKISATLNPSGENDLQNLIDRLKTEEQILGEQYAKDLETAAGQKELLLEIERKYLEDVKAIRDEDRQATLDADQEAFDIMNSLRQQSLKGEKDKADANKKANQDKEKAENAYVDVAINASSLLFEDNKNAQYANAFINTATAVTKALPNYPLAAAVAASGAIQLASISSASKGSGGGSVSAPSDPGLEEEAPTLEAQNSDLSGSNQTVTIRFDDSTELGVAFNNAIERSRQDGLI